MVKNVVSEFLAEKNQKNQFLFFLVLGGLSPRHRITYIRALVFDGGSSVAQGGSSVVQGGPSVTPPHTFLFIQSLSKNSRQPLPTPCPQCHCCCGTAVRWQHCLRAAHIHTINSMNPSKANLLFGLVFKENAFSKKRGGCFRITFQ